MNLEVHRNPNTFSLHIFFFHFLIAIFLVFPPVTGVWAQKKKDNKKKSQEEIKETFGKNTSQVNLMGNARNLNQAEYLFSEGMKHYILEEYKKAIVLFKESENLNPKNSGTKYKIAQTYLEMEDIDSAKPYIEKAIQMEDDNQYYYMLLADIHKKKGESEKVVEVYKTLLSKVEGGEEFYYELASAYLYLSDFENAIKAYNKAEDMFGLNEAVVRQKQKIYLNLNDLDAALTEGQKLVEAFPENSQYSIAQAQMLLGSNKVAQASKILQELLENSPEDAEAQFMLAQVYLAQGDTEKGDPLMEASFQNSELDFSKKLDVLRSYFQSVYSGQDEPRGKKLAKMAVGAHSESAEANSIYGDFLMITGEKKEAREHYLIALEIDGDNFDDWQKVLNLDWELKQFESLAKHSESALDLFPNQVLLYLYNGTANYMLKNYDEAVGSLEMGKMYAISPEHKVQFNSQLGDIYHQIEEFEKSDEAYQDVLKTDPENVHVLNNYTYYLSLRKENLEYAKEMGEKLIKLSPENPNHLDTFGWLLYVKGDFKESKKYLERAVNASQDNATILEHYGDVLFQLGDKEGALSQWKKAKDIGGTEDQGNLDKKIAQGGL